MSQKAMGVILMSSMITINIVAMTNCISIAVAQYNPSTGQDTSSLSPPSPSSPSSSPQSSSFGQSTSSSSPPPNQQPIKAPVVNTSSSSPPPNQQPIKAPVVNTSSSSPPPNQQPIKAPVVNSSTISSPPNPVLVGPSNFIASPITSEIQEKVNATSSPPNEGLFLGSPGR